MSKNRRGVSEGSSSNTIYLTMSRGSFVKRVKEPTEKSIERALEKGENAGKIVHEEHFSEFVGFLEEINVEDSDKFGKSWAFKFDISQEEETPEKAILKLPYSSGYANNILTRLPNIDYTDDIKLSGYKFKPADSDKERIGISVAQWDKTDKLNKVFPAYTKDNPNGCPPMVQLTVKGQKVWDDTEKLEFLLNMVETTIKPQLKGSSEPSYSAVENQSNKQREQTFESEGKREESDDLPF